MLVAHVVPGYFAAVKSRPSWNADWGPVPRAVLWGVALASTLAPDADIIYNTVFRGAIYHSVVWTHSVILWGGIGIIWVVLGLANRWAYFRTLVGLMTWGGISHLALDVVAHGTPLLYPLSMRAFGIAPQRVVDLGFWAYVTDPVALLELLIIAVAAHHWVWRRSWSVRTRKFGAVVVWSVVAVGSILFLSFLPEFRAAVSLP